MNLMQATLNIEELTKENQLLRERIESQKDMLNRTTSYMDDIQKELEQSKLAIVRQNELLELKVLQRTKSLKSSLNKLKKENKFRLELQKQLEESNQTLEEFLYRASHDLRGPVVSSLGLLQFMPQTDISVCDLSKKMEASLKNLDGLLNHISLMARIRKEKEDVSVFNLKQEINESFHRIQTKHHSKAYLSTEWIGGNHEKVKLPATSFATLLDMLMDNCFVFGEVSERLKIHFRCTLSSKTLDIQLLNNGESPSEKTIKHAFDMFYRGSVKSKGAGLGLFLSKEIVSNLEGSINIQTNKDLNGALIHISIPSIK